LDAWVHAIEGILVQFFTEWAPINMIMINQWCSYRFMSNCLYVFRHSFRVSNPLRLFSSSALHFFRLFFRVHHPVNRDDRHLLANAMASDFSVTWRFRHSCFIVSNNNCVLLILQDIVTLGVK
jgi:hypothetical protein